jgi:hypothetical protein
MDELTRERFWPGTHVFVPDGKTWPDRLERCLECGLPRPNRTHRIPDVTEEQAEHRRRAGEVEAA